MHRFLIPLFGFALSVVSGSLAASDVELFKTTLDDLRLVNDKLVGTDKSGQSYELSVQNDELTLSPKKLPTDTSDDIDILPDGEISQSSGLIRRAWLGGATKRYDHGVLGDALEASKLLVIDENNQQHVLELPSLEVFEDRYPRITDINDDDNAEAIVIRTHIDTGAAIATYTIKDNELVLNAASETIGLSHRWLNIVGAADFDGDGNTEIAAVITPHIGGTLTLYRQVSQKLRVVFEQYGFSNHKYGSRELRMSAMHDFNNDGLMDLAVPNTNRRSLILMTLKNGSYKELARIDNPTEIKTGIYPIDIDTDGIGELVYLLNDNSLAVVNP